MKILKEEQDEEYECPNCKIPLEFDGNEMKEKWKLCCIWPFYDPTTGNGWFYCDKCKKRYLIENYANQEDSE